MRFRRILPPPGRLARWIVGAIVLGFATPTAVFGIVALAGHYPIGSWLPRSLLWTSFGAGLAISVIAVIILMAGPLYCLLAWNWRPIALAVLFELSLLAGSVSGALAGKHMQILAFELLRSRSSEVVSAIANYARVNGAPPATLADLVPVYLPSIPLTGMSLRPNYDYEPRPGPCNFNQKLDNKWHLSVWVPDFLSVHHLFYCPQQGEWLYELSD